MKRLLLLTSLMICKMAGADSAQLRINGDLMIHPSQMTSLLNFANGKINGSENWDWPELRFEKPYHTQWSAVTVKGPFQMNLNTELLSAQEVGFELTWENPSISVGQFQIDDTISRNVGGANIIVHFAGQCTGMSVVIPHGQWKVKGRLAWNWNQTRVDVRWLDFSFAMNGQAAAQSDLGDCQGPTGLKPAMQQAFDAILKDPLWMQDVFRDGIMDWVQNSLASLQTELLKERVIELKPGLALSWQPEGLQGLSGGLVRVMGHLAMNRDGLPKATQTLIDRSSSEASLASVKESGFVLPKSTMASVLNFVYSTGDLRMRMASDQIDSFSSLMRSRFMQFFVWPDLMQFAKSSVFYFDVTTERAPKLTAATMLDQGGVRYSLQAPLMVHQWAPADRQYLPYVDFQSQMNGALEVHVQDEKLTLTMSPDPMNVNATFRPEFAKWRTVSARIATSLLGSRVRDYLAEKKISFDVPQWALSNGIAIQIRDVQEWKQSFRIPLQFKKSK